MNTTYAKVQIQKSNYFEPRYKTAYNLKIADTIKPRINRAYMTFIEDVLKELAPVKRQPLDDYNGTVSKG